MCSPVRPQRQSFANGIVPGLWASLGRAMKGLTGSHGSCLIGQECMPVIVLPNFLTYGANRAGDTSSIPIGSSQSFTYLSVPAGERWTIHTLRVERISGDNSIVELWMQAPPGYWSGTGGSVISLSIVPATTDIIFPNAQVGNRIGSGILLPGHILEPGTLLQVAMAGVGTAVSVVRGIALVTVSKVVWDKSP